MPQTLETLRELEAEWARALRTVSLVAEIDADEEAVRKAVQPLGRAHRLADYGEAKPLFTRRYPACLSHAHTRNLERSGIVWNVQERSRSLDVDELLHQLAALTNTRDLDQQTVERVSWALGAADQAIRATRTSAAATPARQQAVDALSELGVPATPALIADFHRAHFGSELAARALASIRRDELRAYRTKGSTRSMWVVPALTTRLLPARGYLALSSWPGWLRILGTRSARVDRLRMLIVLIDAIAGLATAGSDRLRAARELRRDRLTELLIQTGVDLPGIGQTIDHRTAREAMQDELGRIAPKDRAEREDAAAQLSSLCEEQQLFGRSLSG